MTAAKTKAPLKGAEAPEAGPKKRTRNRPPGMEGTAWTEADFAERGYRRLNVRLQAEGAKDLDALVSVWGVGTTEVVRRALRIAMGALPPAVAVRGRSAAERKGRKKTLA